MATFEHIRWTAAINSATEAKARRVLRRFEETTRQGSTIVELQRDRHEPSLFVAFIRTPLGEVAVAAVVFRTLRICRRVASQWVVNGPYEISDGWEFRGELDRRRAKIAVAGLMSITFLIATDAEAGGPWHPER